MTIVLTFAGVQLVLSWNLHRVYLKLHNDFKGAMDNIGEKRKQKFSNELGNMVNSAMDDLMDQQAENRSKYELNNPGYLGKIKQLYSVVVDADKPEDIYKRARDSVRTAHRYFMISGITTLLGGIPAITGEQVFVILYAAFLMPLSFAVIAWDDYYGVEKEIVELRDKGE